jgi:hypothetical protein
MRWQRWWRQRELGGNNDCDGAGRQRLKGQRGRRWDGEGGDGRQRSARRVRCRRWRRRQQRWQAKADADELETRAGATTTAGEDADGQWTSAGSDDNGRRGRTLTGEGREPVRRRRQARSLTGKGQEPARRQTTTAFLGIIIKLGTIDSIFVRRS